MENEKYLLVDIGDSGILYMVVTGNPVQSINNLARDIKTGSALQLGNAESNYIFHKKDIINKILEKCEKFDIDTICINLPSQYDNLALLSKTVKKSTIYNEIIKADQRFNVDKSVLIYGPLKRTETGSIVTSVSAVNKEYMDIIEAIDSEVNVNITTSFTRLQLLAEDKVDQGLVQDTFVIMDAGYSGTRAIVFDEIATPTGVFKSALSGRDIVEHMDGDDPLICDNNFTARQGMNDKVKSYVNSNASLTVKQLRAKTKDIPCKVFIYGGLSTLPWKRACKGYDIEVMSCEYLLENNKQIAIKTALMFDTPFIGCNKLERVTKQRPASRKTNTVQLDEETSEDYINEVKPPKTKTSKTQKTDKQPKQQETDEKKRKTKDSPTAEKKQKTGKSQPPKKQVKQKKVSEVVDLEDDGDLPEEVVDKPKRKAPGNLFTSKKKQSVDEDEEDLEDYDSKRRFTPKTAIIIIVSIIVCCIVCAFTVSMFIDYKTGAKENEITITTERASLTTHVQKIIESKGIKVSACKSEVIGSKEFLYLGLTDIQQEVLDDLLLTLSDDCDVLQNDVIYSAENKISLTLSIAYK